MIELKILQTEQKKQEIEIVQRSIERKANKTSRKKSKIGDPHNVRVCNLMEEFNKNFFENAKIKMKREKKKLKVMEDLKKIEEDKENERIMIIYISNMEQERQGYYQLRKK
ncbi:hypothetical protein Droror1_Dr00017497 [Drosera rotundifolia]